MKEWLVVALALPIGIALGVAGSASALGPCVYDDAEADLALTVVTVGGADTPVALGPETARVVMSPHFGEDPPRLRLVIGDESISLTAVP